MELRFVCIFANGRLWVDRLSVSAIPGVVHLTNKIDADLVSDEGEFCEADGSMRRPDAVSRAQLISWFLQRNKINIVLYSTIVFAVMYLWLN